MMQKPPPIQWLPVFETAARCLNFRVAAKELCVTPPAISQQIKNLEAYLGVVLFDRSSKQLRLTEAGKFYYDYALDIIKRHENAYRQFERKYRHPILQLSAPIFIAQELLIPNYSEFNEFAPGIELRITTGNEYIDFENEPFDAALRFGPGNWPELDCRLISRVEPRLVCSPSYAEKHDLNTGGIITKEDLKIHTVLSVFEDLQDWQSILSGEMPNKKIICDSYFSAIRSAEEGLGIAVGLKPITNRLVDSKRLSYLHTATMTTDYSYWLVAPKSGVDMEHLDALHNWITSLFDKL